LGKISCIFTKLGNTPYWIDLYVVLRRVLTVLLCNWMAESGENINGEQEMSASAGSKILGDIGKFIDI
jgi:hypothetical protein